jgi:hypothetical protein
MIAEILQGDLILTQGITLHCRFPSSICGRNINRH